MTRRNAYSALLTSDHAGLFDPLAIQDLTLLRATSLRLKLWRVGRLRHARRLTGGRVFVSPIRQQLKSLALAVAASVASNALSQDEPRPRPTWQDAMAKGMVPYHQLTVDDFPINDKAHPQDNFYIHAAMAPQYHFIFKPYNGFVYAAIDEWMVFSGLDKAGTSRKSRFKAMQAALPYAQAILDLNEILARQIAALKTGELPSARGNTPEEARTQLTAKLKEFLTAKYKEADAEAEAFAKTTGHGANKKKVRELASAIRKRLEATPAATVPFSEAPASGSSPVVTPAPLPQATATPVPSPPSTAPKKVGLRSAMEWTSKQASQRWLAIARDAGRNPETRAHGFA
jgi:hypothetical protein